MLILKNSCFSNARCYFVPIQDLTHQIQWSHHVSRLMYIISQWEKKLREYSGTNGDAAVGPAGAVRAAAVSLFPPLALGVAAFDYLFSGGNEENKLKQTIIKTLEVNEELKKFYHFLS